MASEASGAPIWPLHGLAGLREQLAMTIAAGRMHHAMLLTGPRGVGKRTLARALARGALCARPTSGAEAAADVEAEALAFGCGNCGPCGRIDRDQHPDLRVVARPPGKTRIPVETLRALVAELGRGALEGRGRVAILVRADRLQREGQNALLKTLEEPERAARLILTAERPEALLDTVRSRCERIAVPPLPQAELRAILEGEAYANEAERLASLAQGSLGLARSFGQEGLLGLEAMCKPMLDEALCAKTAPQAFAARALEGVEGTPEGGGLRQAKIDRARHVLLLVARFLREQALASAGVRAASPDAAPASGPDASSGAHHGRDWERIEACLAGLGDLDAGLGAELVLAAVFDRCRRVA